MTQPAYIPGVHRAAFAAAAAALVLILMGGLVTSTRSGDAVDTWPLPVILPPLGKAGIELSHRYLGALVGLLTIYAAVQTARHESRAGVRKLAWATVAGVIAQGLLGGLRIFYPEDRHPQERALIAVIHGCVAQAFFCLLVALWLTTSRSWTSSSTDSNPEPAKFRKFAVAVVVAMYLQIVLGALLRHTGELLPAGALLWSHVAGAIVVTALTGGFAIALQSRRRPEWTRPSAWLISLLGVQLMLGLGAFMIFDPGSRDVRASALVPTLHVGVGVLCLAAAVACALAVFRVPAGGPSAPSLQNSRLQVQL